MGKLFLYTSGHGRKKTVQNSESVFLVIVESLTPGFMKTSIVGPLLVFAWVASLASVETRWIGGSVDDLLTNPENWSRGLPVDGLQGVFPESAKATIPLFVISGYSVHQSGGELVDHNGGLQASNWILSGGRFDHTNRFILARGSTFTVDGGTLRATPELRLQQNSALRLRSGKVVLDGNLAPRENSSVVMEGGRFEINGFVNMLDQENNKLVINGGYFKADKLVVHNGNTIIIGGDAQVHFTGSMIGGKGLSFEGTSTLDFRGESPHASLTFAGGPRIAYQELWDTDRLLLHGQSKSDLGGLPFHQTHFRVSGPNAETLSIVPEPAAATWLAGMLCLLFLWRRRQG